MVYYISNCHDHELKICDSEIVGFGEGSIINLKNNLDYVPDVWMVDNSEVEDIDSEKYLYASDSMTTCYRVDYDPKEKYNFYEYYDYHYERTDCLIPEYDIYDIKYHIDMLRKQGGYRVFIYVAIKGKTMNVITLTSPAHIDVAMEDYDKVYLVL